MDIFISSFIAGSVQTIIGHPFDTLKTYIQLGKPITNKINIFHLYRGSLPALYSGCFQNGVLFTIHQKIYDKTNNHFIAGCIGGSISSIIVSPLEYFKCNLQKDTIANNSVYKLNFNNLINKNIWKGFRYTLYRDSIGLGIYFYSYHLFEKDLGVFNSGGIAGLLSWIYSYPFDKIKTLNQCNLHYNVNSSYSLYSLYKGFTLVAIRSILVNSCLFSVFKLLNT